MRRPSFTVASNVVTVLVLMGAVAALLKPLIPPPKANQLQIETAEYLTQAERQQINWHPLNEAAFAEARQTERPILFLVGASWSAFARRFDEEVLTDLDVQRFLARNFICVRVDASEKPEWLNAYIPLAQAASGMRPGFQMFFLTPSGEMYHYFGLSRRTVGIDPPGFLRVLLDARKRYTERFRQTPDETSGAALQDNERKLLQESGLASLPNYSDYQQSLSNQNGAVLHPNVWRYLLLTGQNETAAQNLEAVLKLPVVDWIDGGFFRLLPSGTRTEFDKIAVSNAEMLRSLAIADQQSPNPLFRYVAERTFDTLAHDFLDEDELIFACRVGDEGARDRSERSGLTPPRLRDLIPDGVKRQRFERVFGLKLSSNPQAVPVLKTSFPQEREFIIKSLSEIHQALPKRQKFAGRGSVAVTGFVTARLLETARLWNDPQRLSVASDLAERLQKLRVGPSDVLHDLGAIGKGTPYLGDYLGYSDAALQNYLANGRVVALNDGLRVLERALELFKTDTPGCFRAGLPPTSKLCPQGADLPDVLDTLNESCTAQLIRLCSDYGRILQVRGEAAGDPLIATAQAATQRFANLPTNLPNACAGYVCATLSVADPIFAIAVGPNAQEQANQLYRVCPTRLIAPMFDLDWPAGIYFMNGTQKIGPLSAEAAITRLTGHPAVR